jgi:hypothetical protein
MVVALKRLAFGEGTLDALPLWSARLVLVNFDA